jgi:hypothetical protein
MRNEKVMNGLQKREAERREAQLQLSAPHIRALPPECASQTSLRSLRKPICIAEARHGPFRSRERPAFGRAHLSALHRGFRRRANAFDSAQAALHAMKSAKALPSLLDRAYCCSHQAGHPPLWYETRHHLCEV